MPIQNPRSRAIASRGTIEPRSRAIVSRGTTEQQ